MEPPLTFDGIWYRAKPAKESTRADPFARERGQLIVEDDAIRFEGKKMRLVMRDVEAMEYGVHGSMTNPSVHVRYRDGGESRSAWLTDGGMGGFSGVFGGTRRVAEALSHLGPTTFEDEGASRSQMRLAWILGGMVLLFIVRVFF